MRVLLVLYYIIFLDYIILYYIIYVYVCTDISYRFVATTLECVTCRICSAPLPLGIAALWRGAFCRAFRGALRENFARVPHLPSLPDLFHRLQCFGGNCEEVSIPSSLSWVILISNNSWPKINNTRFWYRYSYCCYYNNPQSNR